MAQQRSRVGVRPRPVLLRVTDEFFQRLHESARRTNSSLNFEITRLLQLALENEKPHETA